MPYTHLVILSLAALVSTVMWFINIGRRFHIHVLALILWSSVLMFTVDKVFSFLTGEDGGLVEFSGEAFVLGLVLLCSALMIWFLYVAVKRYKRIQ